MKRSIYILLFLLTPTTFAMSNSPEGTVTAMTVGSTYARVATTSMTNAEDCSSNVYFRLSYVDDPEGKMFSAILAAKAAKQKIFFQLAGCTGNYPRITHIYLP